MGYRSNDRNYRQFSFRFRKASSEDALYQRVPFDCFMELQKGFSTNWPFADKLAIAEKTNRLDPELADQASRWRNGRLTNCPKIRAAFSKASLVFSVLWQAFQAVYRPSLCWFEWNLCLFSTVRAHCIVHNPWRSVKVAAPSSGIPFSIPEISTITQVFLRSPFQCPFPIIGRLLNFYT